MVVETDLEKGEKKICLMSIEFQFCEMEKF